MKKNSNSILLVFMSTYIFKLYYKILILFNIIYILNFISYSSYNFFISVLIIVVHKHELNENVKLV